MSRDAAIQQLVAGEALLQGDRAADGLTLMLEAYVVLDELDGSEAKGVKELRSWLVKALDQLGLPDEAASLRQLGSYVEHPLSVMPSTWFKASASVTSESMSLEAAMTALERGLGLLERGEVEGLGVLFEVYAVVDRELGPAAEDVEVLRSFLVGLLEVGGFTDEAAALRERGSVTEPSDDERQVYALTWQRIIAAEASGAPVLSGDFDKRSFKAPLAGEESEESEESEEEPNEPKKPKRQRSSRGSADVEAGSAVPSVGIDLGLGSFSPDVGTKGLVWTLGLQVQWTLFRVKFFSMQLGGGAMFGRNRDKRWLTDSWGSVGMAFDFNKLYLIPEFGGGYDGVAGGGRSKATALHVALAGFYQFGGTLGVRISDRFGLYGRAVRLNRADVVIANETRIRAGMLVRVNKATLDLAFMFTDYVPANEAPGARLFGGILGFRF